MSKYGRVIGGVIHDAVEVPDVVPFGGDAEGFLAIMYPGVEGFVPVPDYVAPIATTPEQPAPSKADLMAKVQELIDAQKQLISAVTALADDPAPVEIMHVQV